MKKVLTFFVSFGLVLIYYSAEAQNSLHNPTQISTQAETYNLDWDHESSFHPPEGAIFRQDQHFKFSLKEAKVNLQRQSLHTKPWENLRLQVLISKVDIVGIPQDKQIREELIKELSYPCHFELNPATEELRSLAFDPHHGPLARGLLREWVHLFAPLHVGQAKQVYPLGIYHSETKATQAQLLERRFIALESPPDTRAQIEGLLAQSTDSQGKFNALKLNLSVHLKHQDGSDNSHHFNGKLSLEGPKHSLVQNTSPITPLVPGTLQGTEDQESLNLAMDRKRIKGQSFSQLIQSIRTWETDGSDPKGLRKLWLRLETFLRLDPAKAEEAAQLMRDIKVDDERFAVISAALGGAGTPEAQEELWQLQEEYSHIDYVHADLIFNFALMNKTSTKTLTHFKDYLKNGDPQNIAYRRILCASGSVLRKHPDKELEALLIDIFTKTEDSATHEAAVVGLGNAAQDSYLPLALSYLKHPEPAQRLEGLEILRLIAGNENTKIHTELFTSLKDPIPEVSIKASQILSERFLERSDLRNIATAFRSAHLDEQKINLAKALRAAGHDSQFTQKILEELGGICSEGPACKVIESLLRSAS